MSDPIRAGKLADNQFGIGGGITLGGPYGPNVPNQIGKPGQVWSGKEWIDPPSQPPKKNPKDAIASNKIPLNLFPAVAIAHGSMAMLEGMLKYGRDNFIGTEVLASVYLGGLMRHTKAYEEGITIDPESGLHNLGHALANIAILLAAEEAGTLVDDRKMEGGYQKLVDRLLPDVKRLIDKYADRPAPYHFTIKDKR